MRAQFPSRQWVEDFPSPPNNTAYWVMTNENGAMPAYWFATTEAPTPFPAKGPHVDASVDAMVHTEETVQARVGPWMIGYEFSSCNNDDSIAVILNPVGGVCYGMWSQARPSIGAVQITGHVSQMNLYHGRSCDDYRFGVRDFHGCWPDLRDRISSVWLIS